MSKETLETEDKLIDESAIEKELSPEKFKEELEKMKSQLREYEKRLREIEKKHERKIYEEKGFVMTGGEREQRFKEGPALH